MLPGFDALLDQERPVRLLKAALASGNLPHAYLFTGPEGVGKKSAAQSMAMALNCRGRSEKQSGRSRDVEAADTEQTVYPTDPCGGCRACRKIASASHPDVYRLSPAGSYLKVDQIREMGRRLSLKSHEAKVRVAIIEAAHTLNPEAGNTLLKVLEEPPENTLFILLARQASELLPTIVSRCRHIRFNPISAESLAAHLKANYAIPAAEADVIARMSGGSLTRAAAMTEKDWIAHRRWLIAVLSELDAQPVNYHLAFAEALARDTERLPTALEIMKSWFRDLAVCNHRPDHLINQDLSNTMAELRKHYPHQRLLAISRAIEMAAHRIENNANARLALDQLVIALSDKELGSNGENHRYPV